MTSPHVSALTVIFVAFGGGSALALAGGCPAPAHDTATHLESATTSLGVDFGKAGNSRETLMVFYGQLSSEEKSDVCLHCSAALKATTVSLSADEKTFCQAVLSVN